MLGVRRRDRQSRVVAVVGGTFLLLFGGVRTATPNTVSAISWDVESSGRTIITIACAEPIDTASFRSYPIPDPPRAVVVLEGITKPVKPAVLTVNNRHIRQVRLGHHADLPTPELHVILDLSSDDVQIFDIRHDRTRLIVEVGTLPILVETSIPLPSETPSPSPVVPTPTQGPSETPAPPPSLPPTPTPAPSFTETPSYPDRPAPPVLPPPSRKPSRVPTLEPTRTPQALATPTPDPDPISATRIVDIATSLRGDGSTLLRLTADGRLPLGCARTLEVDGDPPRIILTIRAVSAPGIPRTIEVGDPNLNRVRLIHDAETSLGELHLVLHLTRIGISVAEVNQVGPHLVVRLSATEPAGLRP